LPTRRFLLKALLAIGIAWAMVGVARLAGLTQSGLRAQYFATQDWTGPPARTQVDPEVSTIQMSRGWRFTPRDVFSIRWSGYLFVDRPGDYLFRTISDDGSELYVDGRLIVNNAGVHGLIARDGHIRLDAGPHAVVLRFSQAGGPYELSWLWARDQQPPLPVPAWRLSPRARGYSTLLLVRVLNAAWAPLTAALFLLAAPIAAATGCWPAAASGRMSAPTAGARVPLLCLALFVLLACAHTWPLASNPAHLSRNENADTILNEWTLAWVAHQLPRQPLQLFDANIFHPERHALAFSEALLVQSILAAPFLWLGASPVLAYNLVLLAGLALTGWTMCLVVARWTGDWVAGVTSGTLIAFNAHTLTRLPHLQAQHAEFLPLVLFALDRVLRQPGRSSAAWLAIWFVLQALTSIYLLVFSALAVGVAVLARPEDWLGRVKQVAPKLIGAGAAAGVALTPVLLPYWALQNAGFVRSLDEVGYYAAAARDYLTTPSRLYAWAGGTTALFPGLAALTLAAIAIVSGNAWRDARARMCLAFGAFGVLLSFGPAVAPPYEFLYSTVPLLLPIRNSARIGYLGLVAVAVLAGFGMALLRRRLDAVAVRWIRALPAAAVVLCAVEPLAAPVGYQPFDGIPPIYARLRSEPHAVVAEFPFPRPESQFRNAPYLLHSTLNWKPLVNGYSGFIPPSYAEHYLSFNAFPAATAIEALRGAGVTHVFVHLDQFDAGQIDAVEGTSALRPIAQEGSIALYRVERP
jgi:hypothetical protein